MANTADVADPVIHVGMLKRGATLPLPASMMAEKLGPLAEEVSAAAQQAVRQASLEMTDVTKLIFVGGSSLMQVVEQAMTQAFPDASLHRGAALTAIVDGLAIASATAFEV